MTILIDAGEFEEKVLEASGPILVEFYAESSDICVELAPVLDELANERTGKITLAKVNIDKHPGTPQKYGVRGVPTLIIFKDSKPVSKRVGSLPKSKLAEWIDSVIA